MGLRWDRGERALVLRDDHITLQTPDGTESGDSHYGWTCGASLFSGQPA